MKTVTAYVVVALSPGGAARSCVSLKSAESAMETSRTTYQGKQFRSALEIQIEVPDDWELGDRRY